MFHKDFHLLNEIYNQKIVKEDVGMGPQAISDVGPTPTKLAKITIPKRHCGCEESEEHCVYAAKGCKCNGCVECKANQHKDKSEDCEGYNPETYDSNGKMCRQLLFRIFKLSAMLHDLMNGKDNVEAWVLSKLTNAHDQIESVFGYEDYEKALNPQHGMCGDNNFEESNEEELYSAITKGGDVLLNKLSDVLRRESAENLEKVLLETILILEKKKNLT